MVSLPLRPLLLWCLMLFAFLELVRTLDDLSNRVQKCRVRHCHMEALPRMRETGRRFIEPTLAALQLVHPATLQPLRRDTVEIRRRKNMLIQAWRRYERALGLTRTTEPVQEHIASAWKVCHLKTCPCCSLHRPWHEMRVCKGCFTAFYCGEECQTA